MLFCGPISGEEHWRVMKTNRLHGPCFDNNERCFCSFCSESREAHTICKYAQDFEFVWKHYTRCTNIAYLRSAGEGSVTAVVLQSHGFSCVNVSPFHAEPQTLRRAVVRTKVRLLSRHLGWKDGQCLLDVNRTQKTSNSVYLRTLCIHFTKENAVSTLAK